jgi:hypothetical protein
MNNEKYNQIIDEAYENYCSKCNEDEWMKEIKLDLPFPNKSYGLYAQEEFINKCKTDSKFSERWGLKIEERKLSQHERVKLLQEAWKNNGIVPEHEEVSTLWVEYNNLMTKYNIPTKLITVTYKKEKIEIYG